MNYHIIKTIIDSLINNFKCPECLSSVTDKEVFILSTTNTGINLEISCGKCSKKTMVKAETSSIDLSKIPNVSPDMIDKIKQKLKNKKIVKNKNLINDKQIIDMKNILNNDNLGVGDFFKNL